MEKKIILSADSTCDIGQELKEKYDVKFFHYHIQVGDESYIDMEEISSEDIYAAWREKGILPRTAAISPADYYEFFRQWVEEGYEVIHLNLGSGISSSYQNCCITAGELGNVYPVDSQNLSAGIGQLVVKAGEMIREGMTGKAIQEELSKMIPRVHTSFILDTLEFLKAGGRCSALAAYSANLLNLKPCIEVDNQNGSNMKVGKKYRGSIPKVLRQYVKDQLSGRDDIDTSRVFIAHSGSPQEDIELVKEEVKKYVMFDEIHFTRACGTISAHCGPRTLGIMFMTKE